MTILSFCVANHEVNTQQVWQNSNCHTYVYVKYQHVVLLNVFMVLFHKWRLFSLWGIVV